MAVVQGADGRAASPGPGTALAVSQSIGTNADQSTNSSNLPEYTMKTRTNVKAGVGPFDRPSKP